MWGDRWCLLPAPNIYTVSIDDVSLHDPRPGCGPVLHAPAGVTGQPPAMSCAAPCHHRPGEKLAPGHRLDMVQGMQYIPGAAGHSGGTL